jgi:hypothetical protein
MLLCQEVEQVEEEELAEYEEPKFSFRELRQLISMVFAPAHLKRAYG